MRAVGAAAQMRRLLHGDVVDDEAVDVERLVLGVALRVAQQLQQEFGGLLRPAALQAKYLNNFITKIQNTNKMTTENKKGILYIEIPKADEKN